MIIKYKDLLINMDNVISIEIQEGTNLALTHVDGSRGVIRCASAKEATRFFNYIADMSDNMIDFEEMDSMTTISDSSHLFPNLSLDLPKF